MEKLPITSELEQQLLTVTQSIVKKVGLLESLAVGQLSLTKDLPKLTRIEADVLELHLDGNKSKVIGEKLGVTTSHISRTLKMIENKIGKNRRTWIIYSVIHID